jgi:pimeloyl-ACP methyl ester carboxylesterase
VSSASRRSVRAGSLELSAVTWPFSPAVRPRPRALLVHGLASNALLWDPAAEELGTRGWECVGVDLRGHGHSEKPDIGYDHVTVAADCSAVLDSLGWSDAVVLGQSWGANIAVELAASDSRIIGAVAVDGGTIELGSVFPSWEACESAMAPPVFTEVSFSQMAKNMYSYHPEWSPRAIAGALACFERLDDEMIRPWLTRSRHMSIVRDLWSYRISETYARISCPFLFTPADNGDVGWARNKRDSVERALAKMSRGSVHWFPGADHDLHAQKPVEFAEAVDIWWENNQ